jgi:acetyltransferase
LAFAKNSKTNRASLIIKNLKLVFRNNFAFSGEYMTSSLKPFFEPRGVAIIGASASPDKLSYGILKNMMSYGYRGGIYPVNPKAEEILGLPCYSEICQVPDPVDLAVIVLASKLIPSVLEDCGKRAIKAAIIISGGFKEVGVEGRDLEEEVLKIAAKYKIRLIGPNCVGTMNLITGLNTTFIKGVPSSGGIGFISQSGAVCGGVVDHYANAGIGFSHFLSLGNEADVSETDMIEYLGEDEDTRVIAAYVEGIQDGQRFLNITKRVSARKPVVILKAGQSEEGAKAVSSHTGSMAGSHSAYQAAFKQSGAIEAFTTSDLLNIAMALDWLKPPQGNKAAIITNSGGPAALASDSLASNGIKLASISPAIQERLKEKLNPSAQTGNPVDMLGGANEDEFSYALDLVLSDPGVDMALPILVPQALVKPEKVAQAIVDSSRKSAKPVIVCLMGMESIQEARKILHQNHVPMVDFPELTGVMFGALYKRSLMRGMSVDTMEVAVNTGKEIVKSIFENHAEKKVWGEHDTRPILNAYGIPLIKGGLVNSIDEGQKLANLMGYPVVMKVASEQLLHKSEAGVVKVGIADDQSFAETYNLLIEKAKSFNAKAIIEGILIEKMAPKGEEVIIGMKRDPGFGPMLMFGMGGVFVELFKDVSFRIAPISKDEAEKMIRDTKAFQLLNGWRGGAKYDIEAIKNALIRLGKLAMDFPQIQEVEINPLRVLPEGSGALGLDCRLILK